MYMYMYIHNLLSVYMCIKTCWSIQWYDMCVCTFILYVYIYTYIYVYVYVYT